MASSPATPGLREKIEQLARRLSETAATRRAVEAELGETRIKVQQYESAGLTVPEQTAAGPGPDTQPSPGTRELADKVEQLRRQLDQSVRRNLRLQQDLEETRRRLQAARVAKPVASAAAAASRTAAVELSAHTRRLVSQTRHLLTDLDQMSRTGALSRPGQQRLHKQFHQTLGLAEVALRSLLSLSKDSPTEAAQHEAIDSLIALVKDETGRLRAQLNRTGAIVELTEQVDHVLDEAQDGGAVPFREINRIAKQVVQDVHDWPTSGLRLPYIDGTHGYLASHSVNVARLATYLGMQSPTWRDRVVTVASASLIHDLGMARVPRDLLDRPGPLEASELRIIHEHPSISAYLTESMPGIDPLITESVVQHHERLDGSGYPQRRRDDQVNELARLLAVVDGYESMVSPRSWREPVLPREAMGETLQAAEHGKLDKAWVEHFLSLSFYPVGSYVQLSGGELARVVAAATGDHRHAARPVVQLLTDADGHRLWQPEFLNLASCPDRYIVRAVPAATAEADAEAPLAV